MARSRSAMRARISSSDRPARAKALRSPSSMVGRSGCLVCGKRSLNISHPFGWLRTSSITEELVAKKPVDNQGLIMEKRGVQPKKHFDPREHRTCPGSGLPHWLHNLSGSAMVGSFFFFSLPAPLCGSGPSRARPSAHSVSCWVSCWAEALERTGTCPTESAAVVIPVAHRVNLAGLEAGCSASSRQAGSSPAVSTISPGHSGET